VAVVAAVVLAAQQPVEPAVVDRLALSLSPRKSRSHRRRFEQAWAALADAVVLAVWVAVVAAAVLAGLMAEAASKMMAATVDAVVPAAAVVEAGQVAAAVVVPVLRLPAWVIQRLPFRKACCSLASGVLVADQSARLAQMDCQLAPSIAVCDRC
jgi:hypothetical protein